MTAAEIKAMRAKLGLTQEGLARVLNVAYPTILRWESGKYKPSRMGLEKLQRLKEGKQ